MVTRLTLRRRFGALVLAAAALGVVGWIRLRGSRLSPEERCLTNLRTISRALARYRTEHHGAYPRFFIPPLPDRPDLEKQSLYPGYVKDPAVFVCPAASHDRAHPPLPSGLQCDYDYNLPSWLEPSGKLREVFLTEIEPKYEVRITQCGSHPMAKAFVLLLDGSVTTRPWPYDTWFGRDDLFPGYKPSKDALRRRGVDPAGLVYPK